LRNKKKRNILNDYNFAKDIGAKCAFIFTMMPLEPQLKIYI